MSPVALITGGQRGIGLAIAKALAAENFAVAIVSERPADDADAESAVSILGSRSRYIQHDIGVDEGVDAVLDQVEAELGPVTTFVSNAGIPPRVRGDILRVSRESYDSVLAVNVTGAFFFAQAVARRMIAHPGDVYRSMIFITSASAGMITIERSEYCISKAAAAMMAQLFAVRLAPEEIGVFDVRPGIIATGMTAGVAEAYTPRIEDGLVPARRWGTADDVAATVLPLVTGQMAFAQGAVIPVDGGLSIPRF